MRMAAWAIVPMAILSAPAGAQDSVIRTLVDRFEAARRQFDPVALAATLAPDYEEISPVGEVDSREKVLGFYRAELKTPAPPMATDQTIIRPSGDTALITQRSSFTIPGAGTRSIRVRYVARRNAGTWRLLSAQYTPIPPARSK